MESRQVDQPVAADGRYQIAVRAAAVAAVFSLIVCALLLYDFGLRQAEDPHEAAGFKALRLALAQDPDNEELRDQIRTLDRDLRREYLRQRAFTAIGAWLLVGGVGSFLVAAKSAATLRRRLPTPRPGTAPVDRETQWTRTARWAVAGLAVVMMAVALGLSFASRSEAPVQGPPLPSDEQYESMWPCFRGPHGSGISAYTNVPDSWDDQTGKNILWKTPVPLPGMNSPVVWGDRVFVSGASRDRHEVYCFDARTGGLLWQGDVPPHPRAGQMREPEYAGFAAPTLATDGRFVVAIFADGQLAAFELDGSPAWQKSLGIPENNFGHASSLTTYRDLVLVQIDQGTTKQPKSRLYAFHTATGQRAWEVARPVAISWTSPIVVSSGGRNQLITAADPWVIAYDPKDGAELWRARCMSGEAGPSPVFSAGTVYVGKEFCGFSAIRTDGSGDVTATHVLWKGELGLPDTCSPLVTGGYVLLLVEGAMTCYDAKDGTRLWGEYDAFDYPFFTSSPSLVGDRVYLLGEVLDPDAKDEGGEPAKLCKAWVVEVDRQGCRIVGEGRLGEGCVSCPAFQDGRIYIRGQKHVFCIGESQP